MYKQLTFRLNDSNEYEFYWEGYGGAKGEKRQEKRKATPEQIERQNRFNKAKECRRTIKLNFAPGDLFVTLTYKAGEKKSIDEVMKDITQFDRKMRYRHKKAGTEYKWMRVIEIGERGGIHIHLITTKESFDYINEAWTHGHPNYKRLYADGGYAQLADYMSKNQKNKQGELVKKGDYHYSTSRNLKRPIPEVKRYSHWTMRRIIERGIKASPGYYIDKDSIRMGINPVTGKSYLYYTEVKNGGQSVHSPGEAWTIKEKWRDIYTPRGADE